MGEKTVIGWTDHTFNPWIGCQKISPACKHCYAAVSTPTRAIEARRSLPLWGPPSTSMRHRTAPSTWKQPLAWNRAAKREGIRRRVFCASLADVFEDHPSLGPWRADLWPLIEACDAMDWQILTKRPENIPRMVPPSWLDAWPAHVWIGTTVESQEYAELRIPHLFDVRAPVRFVSVEPLLGPLDLTRVDVFKSPPWPASLGGEPKTYLDVLRGEGLRPSRYGVSIDTHTVALSWVIVGGEGGTDARPFDIAWARSIVAQCTAASVPVFVKQLGARPVDSARAAIYQPCMHERRPSIRTSIHRADAPEVAQARVDERDQRLRLAAPQVEHPLYLRGHFRITDKAGADPGEWTADLRRQEFPAVPRG